MNNAYISVAGVTAALNLAAAVADFRRTGWIMTNMTRYGIPPRWIVPLGVAKAAGAAGLLLGIAVPSIGVLAAAGLALYFVGAVVAVARAKWWSHLPARWCC
ncbi:DoxX-like family protein [Asanoa ishikariensis]|uniref:DoxX-like family protein n=1 Tax=Asanoa ishikariensis TaxID=137265 RepID=A0A1H3TJG3_9ACTN|nr:DoxX family protein [Asanoa ishikariensis]SDZ50462.1 DoxX-like family protein [Asanoa ishikariensis]